MFGLVTVVAVVRCVGVVDVESAVAVVAAEAVDTGVVESVVGTEVAAVVAVAGLALELEALGLFGAVKINFNQRLQQNMFYSFDQQDVVRVL